MDDLIKWIIVSNECWETERVRAGYSNRKRKAIVMAYLRGMTEAAIARKYGVCLMTVSHYITSTVDKAAQIYDEMMEYTKEEINNVYED